jgi:hypothetical protein
MVMAVMRERSPARSGTPGTKKVWISERVARRANEAGLSGETGSDAVRGHPAGMLARSMDEALTPFSSV